MKGLSSTYAATLEKADKGLHADLRLMLMPDLSEAGSPAEGLFLACLEGRKLPPSVAVFSPRGLGRTWLETASGPETTALIVLREENGGFWYSERPLAAQTSAPALIPDDLDALHYSVETTIDKDMDIEGRTTVRLRAGREGVRIIPLDLFAKLRLSSVRRKREDGSAVDVPCIQGDEKSMDPILVILDRPLASGEEVELSAEYQGEGVLRDAGSADFNLGARKNWYPALKGFRGWAVYDLEYRYPVNLARSSAKGNYVNIVSMGMLVESGEAGDFAFCRYTTRKPVPGAGFNYGVFRLFEQDDPDSGVKVRVYPNIDAPSSFADFRQMAASGSMDGGAARTAHYDPSSMARDILADCINTARVGTLYFGPLLQNDIAVTGQPQWMFGRAGQR